MALVLSGKLDLEGFEEERHMAAYSKRLPLAENIHHIETVNSTDSNDANKEDTQHCFSPKFQSPRKSHHSTDNPSSTNGTTTDYLSCLANVCETQCVTPKKKSTNEHSEHSFSKHDIESVLLSSQKLNGRFRDKENRLSPKFQSPRKRQHISSESHGTTTNGTSSNLSYLANVCDAQSVTPKKKSSNDHFEAPSGSPSKSRRDLMERLQSGSWGISAAKKGADGTGKDLSNFANACEAQTVTPKKKITNNHFEPPLTPTANLKMLFSAVSPELRRRDRLREEENDKCRQCLTTQIDEEEDYEEGVPSPKSLFSDDSRLMMADSPKPCLSDTSLIMDPDSSKMLTYSRKVKSLGLLCQKFLAKYPIYPDQNAGIAISLDEVAKDLAVERRRIYDIVNVLESVEIVSRVAKNKYAWHGKTNLCNTLAKLKALAEREGFQEQMNKIKEYERKKDLDESYNPFPFPEKCNFELESEQGYNNNIPKFLEKSLGIMSQKFLMLFLVLKPKTVNLDLAAKILIGDMTIDKTENSKFKTKIRRLYDIANILTSLDLIKKVHVTEIRGRKPAFKYIGPEIDNTSDINICSTDGCHRPSSRHSLLDCVKNQKIAHILTKPGKRAISRSLATQDDMFAADGAMSANGKKAFSRHASFDSICEVAEKERSKLFSVRPTMTSTSQPCSPSKEKNLPQWKPFFSTSKDNPQQIIWVQKGNEIHEYHVIPSPGHPLPMATPATPISKNDNCIHTPVSIPSLNLSHTLVSVPTVGSKVLPAAVAEQSPLALLKQSTNNQLTPEQMKAVLKSLKDPVPVSAHSGSSLVDASTQSSPPTDQLLNPTCEDKADSGRQSQPQDLPDSSSEPSVGENGKRTSPIRVLHLEPGFQMDNHAMPDSSKSPETVPGQDDLAVPLGSESTQLDNRCFKPISAPAMTTLPAHNCSCCLSKHSIHATQPTTPKLVHLSSQSSPHPMMQLPLLAVTASPAQVTNSFAYTSVTASPAQVTNSFAYTSSGMKLHQLPSQHILTFSPVPTIGLADNSQSGQTLVAFPVSQQSMTLASVQLVQSSCNQMKTPHTPLTMHTPTPLTMHTPTALTMHTPTPLTMHNMTSTPLNHVSFQSPHSVLENIAFATPGSFYRNTPNSNLDHSSSQLSLLAELKRASVQMQEKPPVCAGSAARRLNLIESP